MRRRPQLGPGFDRRNGNGVSVGCRTARYSRTNPSLPPRGFDSRSDEPFTEVQIILFSRTRFDPLRGEFLAVAQAGGRSNSRISRFILGINHVHNNSRIGIPKNASCIRECDQSLIKAARIILVESL